MKLSQFLYRMARLSRDMQAIQKGPDAIAKRVVRRAVYKQVNGQTAKLLNKLLK